MEETNLFSKYDDVKQFKSHDNSIFLAGGVLGNTKLLSNNLKNFPSEEIVNYSNTLGSESLRKMYIEKVLKSSKLKIDNILVTTGATSAIFNILATMFKRGDSIIVLAPCWSIYEPMCKLLGLSMIRYYPNNSETLEFSMYDIEKIIEKNIKGILFSNPSNPTGKMMSKRILNYLDVLSKTKGIKIISDETYFGLGYTNNCSLSDFDNGEMNNIFIVRSLSKFYFSPGIRIGFIISSTNNIIKLHETSKCLYLAPPYVSQYIGERILENPVNKDFVDICHQNLDRLYDLEKKTSALKIIKPDAAYFCSIQILATDGIPYTPDEIFEKTHIVFRDCADFGLQGYLRLNLYIDDIKMSKVLLRIKELVS